MLFLNHLEKNLDSDFYFEKTLTSVLTHIDVFKVILFRILLTVGLSMRYSSYGERA